MSTKGPKLGRTEAEGDFPGGASGKGPACQCRRPRGLGSIPGLGRSPGEGNGNPLQYSCLENPMDGGVWWATLHRVANSLTLLKQLSTHWNNEIKRHLLLGRKIMTNLDIILNSRHSTLLTRGPYGQSYSFSSSHVQM